MDEIRRIIVSSFDMIEEINEYLMLLRGKLFRPSLLLLSSRVGARLLQPGDDGYSASCEVWNARFASTPDVVVTAANTMLAITVCFG